ncbi:MAG: hypothetical protein GX030_02880 [Firmicutes bacterium]|nr:hypothetical protein [Bacillota bacterium]
MNASISLPNSNAAQDTKEKLQISLLGNFRMQMGDYPISVARWKSKKALALLKYLVSKHGEKVPRDVLIELLWPEAETDKSAFHNLHTTIYYLRRSLKPYLGEDHDCIKYSNGLYWIELGDRIWVDIDEFVGSYRQGRELMATDPAASWHHFQQALLLYRDDFLAEDLYEDWAAAAREYYRERYIETTLLAAQLLAEYKQDYTSAVRLCRDALARDPYREELYQAILRYLIQAGRYSEAAVQYQQCAKMLHDEFGLSVSPETKAIYNQMKQLSPVEESLESSGTGSFVCEPQIFNSIVELDLRRQGELTTSPVVIQMTRPAGAFTYDQSQFLLTVLNTVLGRGDVVCQWESNQIAVWLEDPREEVARSVVQRIQQRLKAKPRMMGELSWRLTPVTQLKWPAGNHRAPQQRAYRIRKV